MIDILRRLEGKSYPGYKDIEGSWVFREQVLVVYDMLMSVQYKVPTRDRRLTSV